MPKDTENQNSETPVKISVFLDPDTHKAAKIAAIDEGVSLSRYVSALVAQALEADEDEKRRERNQSKRGKRSA